jgi:excisionase family DNA binding protein
MDDIKETAASRVNYSELLRKDHYTPDEAAYLLGIDNDVINQAVHRGRLPALMVGNDIISIKRGDLVHWLETR